LHLRFRSPDHGHGGLEVLTQVQFACRGELTSGPSTRDHLTAQRHLRGACWTSEVDPLQPVASDRFREE